MFPHGVSPDAAEYHILIHHIKKVYACIFEQRVHKVGNSCVTRLPESPTSWRPESGAFMKWCVISLQAFRLNISF